MAGPGLKCHPFRLDAQAVFLQSRGGHSSVGYSLISEYTLPRPFPRGSSKAPDRGWGGVARCLDVKTEPGPQLASRIMLPSPLSASPASPRPCLLCPRGVELSLCHSVPSSSRPGTCLFLLHISALSPCRLPADVELSVGEAQCASVPRGISTTCAI